MKKSEISVIDESGNFIIGEGETFQLSGESSEWLFSARFWQDINQELGTIFDQYEEDDVDASIAAAVVKALERRVQSLMEIDIQIIEFVYGWTSNGEPIIAVENKSTLVSELECFRDFLIAAVAGGRRLRFSL